MKRQFAFPVLLLSAVFARGGDVFLLEGGEQAYGSAKAGVMGGGFKIKNAPDYYLSPILTGSLAAGRYANDFIRLEVELFGAVSGTGAQNFTTTFWGPSLSLHAFAPVSHQFRFYAGGGVGFFNCELEKKRHAVNDGPSGLMADAGYDDDGRLKATESFAFWTASAGLECDLSGKGVLLDLSARYYLTNRTTLGDTSSVRMEMYGIFAGITVYF